MKLSENSFQITPLPTLVFGAGCVVQLGTHIKSLGKSNALIVTDQGIVAAGIVGQITDALEGEGIESVVYDGVHPNPTAEDVERGSEMLRGMKDAVVVSVGGGSSMDAAKGIALQGPNGGAVTDYQYGCDPAQPANDIICVPTTSGTGSETNMWGMITNKDVGRKMYIAHPSATAKFALLDPALTVGMPAKVTASCGMDVLTHAVEAFVAQGANPYTDGVALQAIKMVATYLPQAYDDGTDLEARAQMQLAAHLATIALNSAGLGICHAMGHPLSARCGAAHGQTLATMLPLIMDFNTDACEAKYAQVAFAMGAGDAAKTAAENTAAAIEAVTRLRARVGTDLSITQLGATQDLIPTLTEDAMVELVMMTTPKFPMPENVTALYEAAL